MYINKEYQLCGAARIIDVKDVIPGDEVNSFDMSFEERDYNDISNMYLTYNHPHAREVVAPDSLVSTLSSTSSSSTSGLADQLVDAYIPNLDADELLKSAFLILSRTCMKGIINALSIGMEYPHYLLSPFFSNLALVCNQEATKCHTSNTRTHRLTVTKRNRKRIAVPFISNSYYTSTLKDTTL